MSKNVLYEDIFIVIVVVIYHENKLKNINGSPNSDCQGLLYIKCRYIKKSISKKTF